MRYESSKHIFAYWRRLRAGRPAPERSAIDPGALGRFLPDVFMLERGDGLDLRFRLAGASLCRLFGQELRGRSFLSILTAASAEDAREILTTARDDLLPVVAGISALMPEHRSIAGELLVLPLLHNGHSGPRLLGAIAYAGHDRFTPCDCAGLEILSFRVIGEQDTRHLQPPVEPPVLAGSRGERRGHLVVFEGGIAES